MSNGAIAFALTWTTFLCLAGPPFVATGDATVWFLMIGRFILRLAGAL